MHPGKSTLGSTFVNKLLPLFLLFFQALRPGTAGAENTPAIATDINPIVDYALGLRTDPTGLDANGDAKVDVKDVIYTINHRVPRVSSLLIAGGASSTASRTVTLNHSVSGNPSQFMASESPTFSGATWQSYAAAPSFTLSTGNLMKTVYFKVRTVYGVESSVVSDTIILTEVSPLTVGAAAVGGNITPAGDADWWKITVSASSSYAIETWPGTLASTVIRLYGPNSTTTYITKDQGSASRTPRVALMLAPGTYYAKVQAVDPAATGNYTIKASNLGVLKVGSFSISNGASITTGRAVPLNNACTGAPVQYLASESADFAGATWKTYSTAPSFTLSAGNLTKRVYFKVKDAGGAESTVISDTITLAETGALTVGAAAVTGNITPAGEADWWKFTVAASSTYAIETWPGTLTDNAMSLYGPDSMTTLAASDDNSGTGNAAKLALTLQAGTYYARIQAGGASTSGDYTIKVSDLGALKVNSISINGGASLTINRTVTLNNTCGGAPTHFMASESSSFSGASWKTYSTAPTFTLSSGNASKRVYFKVKDLSGTESAVLSDSITLKEMTALPPDGTVIEGNIAKENEEDWYTLTIATAGLYSIQTYTGSLADTVLGLTDVANPGDSDWINQNDNIYNDDTDLTSKVTVWLAPGTYYVRVKAADASTGTYTVRAWQPANKKLSVNGSSVAGNISSATDEDWYQFTVTAASVYSIETEADGLEDGYMELYDSSSRRIGKNDDRTGTVQGTMPAITAMLAAGTYIVRITGANADETGTYSIRARSGAITGGTVSLMIDGPSAAGVISDPPADKYFESDWYQFIVTEQKDYSILMSLGSLDGAAFGLYWEDENGQLVTIGSTDSGSNGDDPVMENINLIPGVFYIEVQGYNLDDRGSYTIRVRD